MGENGAAPNCTTREDDGTGILDLRVTVHSRNDALATRRAISATLVARVNAVETSAQRMREKERVFGECNIRGYACLQ